jgi:acyl-CoA synthetase (NDP forming)
VNALDCFFDPRHVAVIGASRTPGKFGHTVLRNLKAGGYGGIVSAVNADGSAIDGTPGYRHIGDVPGTVDCAFVALPAAACALALEQCAAAGVRGVIVGASGFAELGTAEGAERQRAIAAVVGASGMRVIGPNTNGLMRTGVRLSLGYNASHAERFEAGCVSIVSHSGALFDGIAKRLRDAGVGIATFVPVGNEVDVTMLDVVEALIVDDATRVIGLVVEGLSDGARLRRLAAAAAAVGKSIVVLKIGRSASGAGAAFAHSSRLAGSARAYDALFAAAGIAAVTTVEALAGACALLAGPCGAASASGLVCVTTSGAGGAILADFASERGLALAGADGAWGGAAAAAIAALPTSAAIRNPIDMGSLGDWALLAPVLDALAADGVVGATVVYAHVAPGPGMAQQLAQALIARRARCAAPIAVLTPGGLGAEAEAVYTAAGIPVFHDTAACFDSLRACFQALDRGPGGAALAPPPAATAEDETEPETERETERATERAAVAAMIDTAAQAALPHRFLGEAASAAILARCGVPMVESVEVSSADAARQASARIGGPVVLKALVPGVAHKNACGLVVTRIAGPDDAAREWERLAERLRRAGHDMRTVQFLLQPMMAAEIELILGVSHEPGLGHFLVYGLGGIHAEVFDQVELLAVPVAPARLQARLEASTVARVLRAIDADRAAGWLTQVGAALLALQGLVLAHGDRIDSIDVNPLRVGNDACVAVDALVVLAASTAA